MNPDRMRVSFDPALGAQVRSAARRIGLGISAWLAQAASSRLRAEALTSFIDDWEAEHGNLTTRELSRAAVELGVLQPHHDADM